MKLTKKENLDLSNIVAKYKECYDQIQTIEDQLKNIETQKQEVQQFLEKARKKESSFGKKLKKKYGQGNLNLETLEYELKQ